MSAIIGRNKEVDELRQLVHRTNTLLPHLSRKMVIHSTLVTTYGLTYNQYSGDFVNVVTLDDIFQ